MLKHHSPSNWQLRFSGRKWYPLESFLPGMGVMYVLGRSNAWPSIAAWMLNYFY